MAGSSLAGKKRVKFALKTNPGCEVYVAGSFNSWNARKTRLKGKGGVYTGTVLLPKGKHEYKFVVDGTWCMDPECSEWAANGLGSLNSVINVG